MLPCTPSSAMWDPRPASPAQTDESSHCRAPLGAPLFVIETESCSPVPFTSVHKAGGPGKALHPAQHLLPRQTLCVYLALPDTRDPGRRRSGPAHTSSVREQDLPRALPHKYGKECLGPWECGLQSSHLCPVYQGGLQGRGASSHRKTAVGQAPSLRGRQGERKNNACPKDIYTLIPRS